MLNSIEMSQIAAIRHKGYAVIVWTPEELRGVNPRKVEDRSTELGYEVIDCLATDACRFQVTEPVTLEQFVILCWCVWQMDAASHMSYRSFLSLLTASWIYDKEIIGASRDEVISLMTQGYEGIDGDWVGDLPARLLGRLECEEFNPCFVNAFLEYAITNFTDPEH